MTKEELIDATAYSAGYVEEDVKAIAETLFDVILDELRDGGSVQVKGFGTFSVKELSDKKYRNPHTGEIKISKGHKYPAFKPGKTLRDAVV